MTTTDQSFSARTVPWAIEGATEVTEAVTAADAIQLAGLDWDVELRKDGYQNGKGNWVVDQTKRKVVRVDTDEALGTVSPTYQTLQYREAFDFMDSVHPDFVAAGAQKKGKQAFVVVKSPTQLDVLDGEDPHDLYVVLRSSHDGSRAVEVLLLPLRGTCMNMLPLANFGRSAAKQRWAIRHTKNMHAKLEQARAVLDGSEEYAKVFSETAARLADTDVELDGARRLLEVSAPHWLAKPDETYVDPILDTYQHSSTNGYVGTYWGLLNAVSEYHEHVRGRGERRPETRWTQGLDGAGDKALQRTLQVLNRHAR